MSVRALVVAPNWIGDAVMAQPLLALLRQREPGLRIDALCPPQVAPVFRAMPEVTEVIEAANVHGKLQLAARWRLARTLRARGYQRAYVLPNSAKSALVPWFARIPERIGHRGEARHLLLSRLHDVRAAARPPMVEHYARLAFDPREPLPGKVPDPRLLRRPEREHAVRGKFGFERDAPLIVLCPGAEFGPAKRWPARHFASLVNLLAGEWPEADLVLLGSAGERALATEIAALSGQTVRNLCGDTTLDEAIAIIAQASGVVSNDSGLMHVAAAFTRPQVAIFGSSDPRHTPPRSPRARIEWLHLACSPCFQRVCPLGHTDCLNKIAPATVFASLQQAMRFETTGGRSIR